MSGVIAVLPKIEDARQISGILARRGIGVAALCTTAAMALNKAHELECGVVICSYRISDMHYTQLAQYLPDYFDMLLLTSKEEAHNAPSGMMLLTYPVKPGDLAGTVEMMLVQLERRLKKSRAKPYGKSSLLWAKALSGKWRRKLPGHFLRKTGWSLPAAAVRY